MLVNLLGRFERRERIDKTEELDFECRVFGGPVQQLVGPESRREKALGVGTGSVQQIPADVAGLLLDWVLVPRQSCGLGGLSLRFCSMEQRHIQS